jgi:hypothetical protein
MWPPCGPVNLAGPSPVATAAVTKAVLQAKSRLPVWRDITKRIQVLLVFCSPKKRHLGGWLTPRTIMQAQVKICISSIWGGSIAETKY